ncbi:type I-G CRISPR-associated protein Cas8g1/Csx17 [Phytoactinopolyspora limicola]|uniref:type I-G CRISPR-associated protein Cas8g1/Csx17 n=1 Tax=Phytoactinopolyspora limicola TaxID=2715536 RepID=UPI00140AC863|nr:type I-U CRISPR-associated protein Csx17 [Phytoactinopolyspora limicola]
MNSIVLVGCRAEPLGSYLTGLGLWRAVVRLLDSDAKAHWSAGQMVLTTRFADVDELTARLAETFEPLPIVSPWNAGSGFAGNGRSRSAEDTLNRIRVSTDGRLAAVRHAVAAADRVVTEGRDAGLAGKGAEMWAKKRKADVVMLARNMLPDDALVWVDSTVVLGQDDEPAYNRLLGTGGNFGRQDLSATYLERAVALVDRPDLTRLRAALTGDESVRYSRDAVGQFDPGRAGGVQSSPWEKSDDRGFVNPWSFVLGLEGAVLFAAAVVRRYGAQSVNAAVPFVVAASTAGSPDAAAGEQARGEIWTPMWERPARLAEVEQLLSEGRAEWRGTAARTGLDFVRAISSLGVDRGLSSFTRHVVVDRLGQNPLAVPVDRVSVEHRPEVRLLGDLDTWLSGLRGRNLPAAVASELRVLDAAVYAVSSGQDRRGLQRVLMALGSLHDVVARSGRIREVVRPLVLRRPHEWLAALDGGSREVRLAAALASGRDGGKQPGPALRELLTPIRIERGVVRWSDRPTLVPSGVDVATMLAMAHRRRARPGVVPEPGAAADNDGATRDGDVQPAVRGVFSAFRHGSWAPLEDVAAVAMGSIDHRLFGDLLRGFMLADWRRGERADWPKAEWHPIPSALALLLPFYAVHPLRIHQDGDEQERDILLRPGTRWITQLLSGHTAQVAAVLDDARRRLVIAGIERLVRPAADVDGPELAAALLVPTSSSARRRALHAVADLPQPRTENQDLEGAEV